jgi:outer membrane protein assembly factor BamB
MHKKTILTWLIPLVCGCVLLSLLLTWIMHRPAAGFVMLIEGMDNRGKSSSTEVPVEIGALFTRFTDDLPSGSRSWPRFRGAGFDNINREQAPLAASWPADGPALLWQVNLGQGYAGAAIHKDRVYILDHIEEKGTDMLRCFSLATGDEIWRRGYRIKLKRNHGMSRTVPAVTDRFTITIGPRCHMMCVDTDSGDFLWGIDMESEYNTSVPLWYTGQCPLIDNDLAIFAPGGTHLMVAVNCSTGETAWSVPNQDGWKMSHSSIMPMEHNGTKLYLYTYSEGLIAVAADGPKAGTVVCKTTEWKNSVIAPSPLVLDNSRILVTAGYGSGFMILGIDIDNGKFEVLRKGAPGEGPVSEQQTPLFFDNRIYTIQPDDAGPFRNQFTCYDTDGNLLWSSGKSARFGLGPYMVADNRFYILNDDGTLYMADAKSNSWEIRDSTAVFEGNDAWGPLALSGGLMVLRDDRAMYCIDIGSGASGQL